MNTQQVQSDLRNNIITMFGIDKLPEDKKEETLNRIGKIIFQNVLMRVLPTLSEEDLAQYEKLIRENVGADKLMEFFFEKTPNFVEIITEESENFRKDSEEMLSQLK